MMSLTTLVAVVALATLATAGPMKMYEKAENEKYRHVLVPISSTVIPLDDLPQYKVSAGFGIRGVPPPGKVKPDGPVKLITIHSLKNKNGKTKKDPNAAMVEELTQEEYKELTQQHHEY